jgi:hypothetical protein
MSSTVRQQKVAAYDHDQYQARKEAGLCTECSKRPAEAGKTRCRTCAQKRAEARRRVVEAGRCTWCHEPRGEDGTQDRCRDCADKMNATHHETYQRRYAAGLCVHCSEPRGEGSSLTQCARCARKANQQEREARRRRFERGLCRQHKAPTLMLRLCPACRYEQPDGQLRDLTLAGLLPPPASGDELESCVGCENCDRLYHQGSSYYVPPIPHDLKLKNERVGEEGHGMWLRFAEENEGYVEAEYEGCSTPEKKCARPVKKNVALKYLLAHRKGGAPWEVPGRCYEHFRDPKAYEEVIAARLRHQLGAAAEQPQTLTETAQPLRDEARLLAREATHVARNGGDWRAVWPECHTDAATMIGSAQPNEVADEHVGRTHYDRSGEALKRAIEREKRCLK